MLCTDGLTEMVADEAIAGVVGTMKTPKEACNDLIRMANAAGGVDNVSVVVARYAASQTAA